MNVYLILQTFISGAHRSGDAFCPQVEERRKFVRRIIWEYIPHPCPRSRVGDGLGKMARELVISPFFFFNYKVITVPQTRRGAYITKLTTPAARDNRAGFINLSFAVYYARWQRNQGKRNGQVRRGGEKRGRDRRKRVIAGKLGAFNYRVIKISSPGDHCRSQRIGRVLFRSFAMLPSSTHIKIFRWSETSQKR